MKLREVPLDDWWNTPAVVVLTYSDLASRHLEPSLYQARLEKMGVLPVLNTTISSGVLGSYVKAILDLITVIICCSSHRFAQRLPLWNYLFYTLNRLRTCTKCFS